MSGEASVVLATAGYDHTVRFWDALNGVCYRTIPYPDSQVNKLEIAPNKAFLAAAGNPHIKLFEIGNNRKEPYSSFKAHTSNVTAIGFNAEGKWMFSGSEDGTVKLWDLRLPPAQGCQVEFICTSGINTVVLHPNQNELISGDQNGSIRMWDLRTNAWTCELVPEMGNPIRSLTIASNSSMIAAGNNTGTCYVWRLQKSVKSYDPALDPSGEPAPVTTFEPFHRLNAHSGHYLLKCLISPDVRLLATTSSDKTVKIWSLEDFHLEQELREHGRWVWDCVFSVDAAYLVTASSDCSARLWNMTNGKSIIQYAGHTKACVCCALNDCNV
mmetsp:Transcript_13792/g.50236  ORF Transcript_13792/g.50236 Transcript_13792/m.50236 type:complete len:327 (+) Transcript_13792:251-1231(+)